MLQPSALTEVEKRLELMFSRSAAVPSELKSTHLLRSERGCDRYAEIGRWLSELGVRVCLSMVEKRYQTCSLIKDTYLDPFEHEFAPMVIGDERFAQRFADACYEALSDERLAEFLTAVDGDVPETIADVGRRLSATLRLHPDEFVSYAAARIETRPEKVFRRARRREALPRNAHIPASQLAAFHPGLDRVEGCLRAMGQTGTLLRDHDAQFGEVLDWAYATGRELDQYEAGRAYGARHQLDSITGCSSASSEQQLGIQLADLAAGFVGRIARGVCLQSPLTAELGRIADSWRTTLAEMERHYVMVSDDKLVDIVPAIFGAEYVRP